MPSLTMVRFGDKIFLNAELGVTQSWSEADARAESWGTGGVLAALHSLDEVIAVRGIMTSKAWIGLVQAPGSAEPDGGWTWRDGSAFDYAFWGQGEPNDAGGEFVGEMSLSSWWNDMPDGSYNSAAIYQFDAMGDLALTGSAGRDRLLGGAGDDTIAGGYGLDRIEGGAGRDQLSAGAGGGVIIGGAGADLLVGGFGADVFRFETAGDSFKADADRIRRFNDAADRLDVSALVSGIHLSPDGVFHGEAGEVVLRPQLTATLNRLQVVLDIDGDGKGDLSLYLVGHHSLTEANFLA